MSDAACATCGTQSPPGARFCMGCGRPIEESRRDERRIVTVVFADLSGFTAAVERMDHEAAKVVVGRYLERLAAEVRGVGGHIDKFIGDCVMGVFGAPTAHEDDPARAVHAGLAMQAAMPELNEQTGASFTLRVGINTGEVTAGHTGSEYTLVGDAVNVASRLQSAARPGSVTVGERTYAATSEAYSYEPIEPLVLKGKSNPVAAWEARGALARTGGAKPAGSGRSPFVGRQDEVRHLEQQLEAAISTRRPRLVTVLGEPGVGKSRLLDELLAAAGGRVAVRYGRCPAFGTGIAYWPLAEVIREECAITDDDSAEQAWEKLLEAAGDPEESDPAGQARGKRRALLIAHLLGMETGEQVAGVEGDPLALRRAAFDAVAAFLGRISRRRGLLLAFDDVHWASPGMLELIELLAESIQGPLLLVCLAREGLLETDPGWCDDLPGASRVHLGPLGVAQMRELLSALLDAPAATLVEALGDRAGGNPFFAEELVHRAVEQGLPGVDELPGNVHAVLTARLDALPATERRVVQHAAVLGPTLSVDLLREVVPAPDELGRALAELERREVLVAAGAGGLAFRHVLIRDVAYQTLAKSSRARMHAQVAELLEQRAGDRYEEVVELLAEHYEPAARLAGEAAMATDELTALRRRAAEVLEAAGDSSATRYSNEAALARYAAARELRNHEDPSLAAVPAIKEGEIALRLGHPSVALERWADAMAAYTASDERHAVAGLHRRMGVAHHRLGETESAVRHFQQGIALVRDEGPSRELAALFSDAARVYVDSAENMLAIYAAEKAVRVAEDLGDVAAAGQAHGVFGQIFARTGDVARAREHLVRSVELARETSPDDHLRALLVLGQHHELAERDRVAARAVYEDGLEIARRIGDAHSEAELVTRLERLDVEQLPVT